MDGSDPAPRSCPAMIRQTHKQGYFYRPSLDGIDIDAMVRHPVRQYQIAG